FNEGLSGEVSVIPVAEVDLDATDHRPLREGEEGDAKHVAGPPLVHRVGVEGDAVGEAAWRVLRIDAGDGRNHTRQEVSAGPVSVGVRSHLVDAGLLAPDLDGKGPGG